jgi:hypothetical protein
VKGYKFLKLGQCPIEVPCFEITRAKKGAKLSSSGHMIVAHHLLRSGCRDFSTRPWKYQRPPSDHTPLSGRCAFGVCDASGTRSGERAISPDP